jgi:glycosyltransferase involved in cell wall biosynthesis
VKIVWFTENYFPRKGGMAQSCDRIVHQLRLLGYEIIVIHLLTTGQLKEETVQQGINIHFPLSNNSSSTIDEGHALNLLWLKIKDLKPQITVAFGGTIAMTATEVFSAWWSIPFIVLLRGNDFDTGVFSHKKREILDRCLSKAHTVCCVSKDKVHKVQSLYPNTRVVFTPNGIETDLWRAFDTDKEKAQTLRNQYLPSNKKVIGLFGQLKAKKGVLFFLDALQLSGYTAQSHLLFVGEMNTEFTEYLTAINENLSYTIQPFLPHYDLIPYYLACDAVAIPSFYDGMPNVLLEAGALGIPIIGSNAGGMPTVLGEKYPFLFSAGDLDDCTQTLQLYFETCDNNIIQIVKNVQETIFQEFTAKKEKERYKKILEIAIKS